MDLDAILDKKAKKLAKKKDKGKSKLSETERIQLGLEEFAGLGTEPIVALNTSEQVEKSAKGAKDFTLTAKGKNNEDDNKNKKESNGIGTNEAVTNIETYANAVNLTAIANNTATSLATLTENNVSDKVSHNNVSDDTMHDVNAKETSNSIDLSLSASSYSNENHINNEKRNTEHSAFTQCERERQRLSKEQEEQEEEELQQQQRKHQTEKEINEFDVHKLPSTIPVHDDDHHQQEQVKNTEVKADNRDHEEKPARNNNENNEHENDDDDDEEEEEAVNAASIDFSDVTISTSSISKKIRSWSDVKVDVLVSKLGKSASSANLNESTKEAEEEKEGKPKKFVARGKRNATGELALKFPLSKSISNAELPTLEEAIARRKNPKEGAAESPHSATSPLTGKASLNENAKNVTWNVENSPTVTSNHSSANASPAPASPKYIPPASRGNLYKPPSSPSPTSPGNLNRPTAFKSSYYETHSLSASVSKRQSEGDSNGSSMPDKTTATTATTTTTTGKGAEVVEDKTIHETNKEQDVKASPTRKYVPPSSSSSSSSPTNVYRPPAFRTGAAGKSNQGLTTLTTTNTTSTSAKPLEALSNNDTNNIIGNKDKDSRNANEGNNAEIKEPVEEEIVKKPAPYRPPMRNTATLPLPPPTPPPPPPSTTTTTSPPSANDAPYAITTAADKRKDVSFASNEAKQVYKPPMRRSSNNTATTNTSESLPPPPPSSSSLPSTNADTVYKAATPYIPPSRKAFDAKNLPRDPTSPVGTSAIPHSVTNNDHSNLEIDEKAKPEGMTVANNINTETKSNVYRPPTSGTSYSSGNAYRPPATRRPYSPPTSLNEASKVSETKEKVNEATSTPALASHDANSNNAPVNSNVYRPPVPSNTAKPNVYRPPSKREATGLY